MSKSFAAIATAVALTAAGTAHADGGLTATVFTGSPAGFLVDSTLIAGTKDAILIDAQFDLADAHRLAAMELEGQTLEIHGGVQGDEAGSSYVWIPSIKTVVAGDVVYSGVHVWTRETGAAQRKAWRKTLDELDALKPIMVVAGHKAPGQKDG